MGQEVLLPFGVWAVKNGHFGVKTGNMLFLSCFCFQKQYKIDMNYANGAGSMLLLWALFMITFSDV